MISTLLVCVTIIACATMISDAIMLSRNEDYITFSRYLTVRIAWFDVWAAHSRWGVYWARFTGRRHPRDPLHKKYFEERDEAERQAREEKLAKAEWQAAQEAC